jgi:protein-S-isoprenylcysteine O-methyltransferase Ste14
MTETQPDHAAVKIEPLVLLLGHALAMFLLSWFLPLPFAFPEFLEWIGYGLILVGLGLASGAIRRFRQADTTTHPYRPVAKIVISGPYRFSRNPIYLGFVCLLVGFSFAFRSYWGLLLSPLFIALMNTLVIKHEETYLEQKFKADYASYKSRVRRWL